MSSEEPKRRTGLLGGLLDSMETIGSFFEVAERVASVAAGLFLAVGFSVIPLVAPEIGEPWYFWVGSGFMALAASALIAWIFFPSRHSDRDKDSDQ